MTKILIVDDKIENIYALRQLLQGVEAEIIAAENGNDALIATLNHEFAVALLDVQMPGMSGYELAELLRGSKATAHLPIIFLSAVYSDDYHVFKGYEAGGVDFLVKPFNPKILVNKVNIFLELDKQRQELLHIIELERSKNYLESILMAVNDVIIVTTPDGMIETVNRAAIDLFEQPPAVLVGTPVTKWLPDAVLQEWLAQPMAGTAVTHDHHPAPLKNIEFTLPRNDKRHLFMLFSGSFLHDKTGIISGRVLAGIELRPISMRC
ncbi:MAG: response regulator [Ardenticatenaceae bacterium]|nr:response regulator [Ardenticatenaceae bacterium]